MGSKLIFLLMLIVIVFNFAAAVPTGPDSLNITTNSSWSGSASGGIVNNSKGYISFLNMTATVQNTKWKAFVGWIDGAFSLVDSGGSTIYDWSLSTTGGEVYASRNSSTVDWGNIACANSSEILAEDVFLQHNGEDNISSTFSGTNTGTYVVAGTSIGVGDCSSTNSYVNNVTQGASFEEFLLHDDANIVFATKVEENVVGYDGVAYDFQMIVPEVGNESFGGSTSYYLYVELN